MIRKLIPSDTEAILSLARKLNMFDEAGLDQIRETLVNYNADEANELWYVIDNLGGVIYSVAEAMTDGTWNILMLLVDPKHHGKGYGRVLMETAEQSLKKKGVRLLVVETSGLDEFSGARAFYAKLGYKEEARIRNFYRFGDDKIILTKELLG